MTRKIINVGVADKGNGDPIRVAFSKANDNFAELYNILSNNTGGSIITTDVIGSVFADDSTLLVDGINGSIPYSVLSGAPTIPAAQVQSNWTAASGMGVILNKPTLFSGSYTDLTNKPTIPTSFSSLVNGANTVSLGSGGALTIPGAIRSEGNINIDINLSDSTLRRWSFGEDGALTFPDGYLKIVPNGANPYISNRTDNGLGLMSGSAVQIRQSTADNYGITIDSSTIDTSLGGGALLASGSSIDVNGSKIIIGQYTVNNLDATTGLTSQNKIEINNNAILIGPYASNTVDGNTITAFTGWTFNKYGTLTFPDATVQTTAWTGIANALRSEGNINIDINLSDSTLRRWQFGEDGNLTLPTGSSIADTVGNAVIGSNSGTVSITNLEVMNFTQLAPSNYLWITNQYYSGSLLTSTFGSLTGTATGATTRVVTGVTQLSTSGRGSGAMFQVTVYYNGSSTTYTAVSIDYNNGNAQYGTGYAVGDTVTIAGASLGGTTPTNNLTFTIGNLVKNNYPAGLDGGIIYDYSNKHFLAYNGSTWTQLDNPLTPSGTKASNAYGVPGQTSFDSNYFYICIATNTWRRVALGSSY